MSKYIGDVSAYAYAVSKGYTGTEEEFAELMASYADVGQTAVDAKDAAAAAKTAAQTAATTATNKAAEAQADADAAALDASQALSAASTATTKATEATTAAATATSAKTDAVAANTAAQSAKTAAQTAQTGAETAAASVQSSAEQIQTNAEDISQLKSDFTDKADQTDLLKAFPTDTASGAVASFSDGANVPVKSLIVNIEPKQEGSGDPSPDNVRPISGWSEVNVHRAGDNLISVYDATVPSYNNNVGAQIDTPMRQDVTLEQLSDGIQITVRSSYAGAMVYTMPLKAGTYYLHGIIPDNTARCTSYVMDGTNTIVSRINNYADSMTIVSTPIQIEDGQKIAFSISRTTTGTLKIAELQVGRANFTNYEPYSGQSITIALGQTVYGGKLDVVRGELVIDRTMVDLGTLDWQSSSTTASSTGKSVQTTISLTKGTLSSVMSNLLCTQYATDINDNVYRGAVGICATVSGKLKIFDTAFLGLSDDQVKVLLSGVYACYELATPITVSLTPHEVNSLLGQNNIFADTGDTEVEYRADTKLYINKKIAEAISALS